MLNSYLLLLIISTLMVAILTNPAICVTGAAAGLLTWFNSVVPSLFPFMVLTGVLIKSGSLTVLTEKLKERSFLRQFPLTAVFAVIIGLLCGYPMGIRTVSDLKHSRQITPKQADILYAFVNQPGPMFVLGYVLPFTGLSDNDTKLFLLSFYGGVLITALLAMITAGFIPFKNQLPSISSASSVVGHQPPSAILLFEDALMSSMANLAKIGGYMILFSLIAALLGELLPMYPTVRLLLSGFLEMTSGIALAADTADISPHLILAFASFGGLSVAAQSFTLGNLSGREQWKYLLWKTIQTTVSVLLFVLFSQHK